MKVFSLSPPVGDGHVDGDSESNTINNRKEFQVI